jgi:hypothetical protein
MKISFPREAYLPKDAPVRVRQYEDIPAMVALVDKGKPVALAWRGKAQKPAWHYSFRSAEQRDKYIATWLENQRAAKASRDAYRAKRQGQHTLRVGQVLTCSWGYDQTNVDWYQVTRVMGKMVEIREISAKLVGEGGGPSEGVVPHVGAFKGEAMRKRPSADNSVRIASYASAYPWDGEPKHQTGYGWGH